MTHSLVDHSRIECDGDGRWPCPAFFEAKYGTEWAHEARREARQNGWQVGIKQNRPPGSRRHLRRLDLCPEHREEPR